MNTFISCLFFLILGVVFILFSKTVSEAFNQHAEKNLKEQAKYLGSQSVNKPEDMKISAPFFRLLGVVLICSSIFFYFYFEVLLK